MDTTNDWQPLAGPYAIWERVFLRSGGVELDSILCYGRHHHQFSHNQASKAEQYGEAGICGFAGSFQAGSIAPQMGRLRPGASVTVSHRLLLSAFNSGRFWPCRYSPLEIELTCHSNYSDFSLQGAGLSANIAITGVQLLFDAVVLDEAVTESFYRALMSSRVLSIPAITCWQTVQSCPPGVTSYSFSSVRAFSRLSHVWVSFRNTGSRSTEFVLPCTQPAGSTGATPYLADGNVPSCRLSIGSKQWPDPSPADTLSQHFSNVQKALGGSIPNLDRDAFKNAYTIVFDLRRVPTDPTTSISTRSGDMLRIDLGNLTAGKSPAEAGTGCTEIWLTLWAFSCVAIRESGVTLLT